MNTAEVYIEPVLIGMLLLVILAMPFVPEILSLATWNDVKAFGDVAPGAILVGAAYMIGILADRLIDTCLQVLERHNRVRFALHSGSGQKRMGSIDPFPEDVYRWAIFGAKKIADNLAYIRTRIRLLRALALLLPGLVLAGVLGVTRLKLKSHCANLADPDQQLWAEGCGQAAWAAALPSVEPSWFVFLAPCLYASALAISTVLGSWEARRARTKRLPRWYRAGMWCPPHTRNKSEMDSYATARGWRVGEEPQRNLLLDIIGQPIIWVLVSLLLASVPSMVFLTHSTVFGSLTVLVCGLLALSAGWAWWRVTGTYMGYLKSSGEYVMKVSHSVESKDA